MPDDVAVLLVAHGTVEELADLGPFITSVRRGRPAPPEIVLELHRRYQAIGGRSPLLEVTRALAAKVEKSLGGALPVRVAMRLWHPYPREVVPELVGRGTKRIIVVPLAQYSADVYAEATRTDLNSAGIEVELRCAPNWGQRGKLHEAYAARIMETISSLGDTFDAKRSTVLMTAHSLPQAVIDAGDRYEVEFRASVAGIAQRLGSGSPHVDVAFQSQGLGGGAWLGPDLPTALDAARQRGHHTVVFAPVGFLADHVEVLYDLDVEAKKMAEDRGLASVRTASLNASDDLAGVIVDLVRELAP